MSVIWKSLNNEAEYGLKESAGIQHVQKSLHPLTFLTYINTIETGNLGLFTDSLRLQAPDQITILPWQHGDYSEPEWKLILESMGKEPVFPRDLIPPDAVALTTARKYLSGILTSLERNSEDYCSLLTSVLNTVILASPGQISRSLGMNFGGSTYFFFWRGTIINTHVTRSYSLFFEQLIHESCHMALFMLCSKYGLLCENPDSELYDSAFRQDSGRPMHGVIHAYFVACNLIECFSSIPGLSYIARKNLRSAESLRREISTHARLTDFGKFILNTPQIKHLDALVESNIEV